ncbi:GGDEF domain-containing protein [Embleya scabrispora]|uniref:GGDEF domain-containing protein n=1 Tax=Embleya scabrispora TaxID=159449 RepID=UPI001374C672|nr:GGDEF domain-containing protein [Embleya scabrispora]
MFLVVLVCASWAVHAWHYTARERDLNSSIRRLETSLHRARHCPLTGLITRDGFELAAADLIAQTTRRRDASCTYVGLVDADYLKRTNDRHGHAGGDAHLRAIADRLRAFCGSDGIAGRIGGDEFAVVVTLDPVDAGPRIRELKRALSQPVTHGERVLDVTASVGFCNAHRARVPLSLSDALQAADMKMYEFKPSKRRRRRT